MLLGSGLETAVERRTAPAMRRGGAHSDTQTLQIQTRACAQFLVLPDCWPNPGSALMAGRTVSYILYPLAHEIHGLYLVSPMPSLL